MAPINPPIFEYRTTFSVIPPRFPEHERIAQDLAKLSPKPPQGGNWQLVSSSNCRFDDGRNVIFFFWERPAQKRVESD